MTIGECSSFNPYPKIRKRKSMKGKGYEVDRHLPPVPMSDCDRIFEKILMDRGYTIEEITELRGR